MLFLLEAQVIADAVPDFSEEKDCREGTGTHFQDAEALIKICKDAGTTMDACLDLRVFEPTPSFADICAALGNTDCFLIEQLLGALSLVCTIVAKRYMREGAVHDPQQLLDDTDAALRGTRKQLPRRCLKMLVRQWFWKSLFNVAHSLVAATTALAALENNFAGTITDTIAGTTADEEVDVDAGTGSQVQVCASGAALDEGLARFQQRGGCCEQLATLAQLMHSVEFKSSTHAAMQRAYVFAVL
jgi:hypothetical protein